MATPEIKTCGPLYWLVFWTIMFGVTAALLLFANLSDFDRAFSIVAATVFALLATQYWGEANGK